MVFDNLYDKGIAVGIPDIKTDVIVFRHRDKVWEFSTSVMIPGRAKYNGNFYEAKVKVLKRLAKEQ